MPGVGAEPVQGAVRRTRRRPHPLLIVVGVIVAGALIAWPLGGWDTVTRTSQQPLALNPGDALTGQQFTAVVESVELSTTEPGTGDDAEAGKVYLAVTATLTNTTTQSWLPYGTQFLLGGLDVPDLDSQAADSVVLLADGDRSPILQPGLATRVAYVWQIPDGAVTPGAPVRVAIVDRTPGESELFSGTAWRDPRRPCAR